MSSSNGSNGQETNQKGQGSIDSKMQQMSSQWAEIIGQLVDRLTGKETSITYTFEDLTIDVPRAQGPNGQNLGSAQWTVNGKIVITAEAHESASTGDERGMQRPLAASSTA